MRRVGLLGAPGTGKSRLAAELIAFCAERGLDSLQFSDLQSDATRATGCAATLVMGLDLPTGVQGEAEDACIRARLQSAGMPFQVVYGQGPQRLRSALQALDAAGVLPAGLVARADEGYGSGAWTWTCDKCSDPACEHRLFTRLREAR